VYAATVVQRVAQLDDAAREWIGLLAYRVIGNTNALFPAPSRDAIDSEQGSIREPPLNSSS
jgi:hypothetical protein